MLKHIAADTSPRPDFSRFLKNLEAKKALPIFPLALPSDGKIGVLLVGDYVVEDLIGTRAVGPDFASKWLIVSMTQSDVIPKDCVHPDINLFSNKSGVPEYLASPAGHVPYELMADGHFVDPEVFFPDSTVEKEWDILYPAKWYPTKQTEILLQAAAADKKVKIAIYGWPVLSERKFQVSRQYRDEITRRASELPNVSIFDSGFESDNFHRTKDGAEIVGRLTRQQMRDVFFRKTRASINLSATTEAVNRACAEMLCCDVPMLVAPTCGGLEQLVNEQTGVLIERSPQGILEGIYKVRERASLWQPRSDFLSQYGRQKTNARLRKLLAAAAERRGQSINWADIRDYGGDLWTPFEVYSQVI